jgi:Fe2+ transport system protein FeoA
VVQLGDLSIGEKAKILGYGAGDRAYRRKLLIMGLTPGTEVTVAGIAPFGDPIKISSRGLFICLRKSEARILKLERLP